MEEKKVFVRGRVAESVKIKFKARCAIENQTMDSVMEELIKNWLEEKENNKNDSK